MFDFYNPNFTFFSRLYTIVHVDMPQQLQIEEQQQQQQRQPAQQLQQRQLKRQPPHHIYIIGSLFHGVAGNAILTFIQNSDENGSFRNPYSVTNAMQTTEILHSG